MATIAMKATRLTPLIISMLLVPTVLFAAGAKEVLRRAQDADKHVSYRGLKTVKVYSHSRFAHATVKVVHLKPNKTRTDYFSPQLLAGIVIIDDGLDSWKYCPAQRVWEHIRCPAASSHDAVSPDAFDNYDIRLLGTDQVAGRTSYVIHAIPNHRGESARRMWVDTKHFLIMATRVETPLGRVINSSRYTSIHFNPGDISPSAFKVPGPVKPAPKPAGIKFKVRKPSYLPKGYRYRGVKGLKIGHHSCAHSRFSNGSNAISLFQRPARKDSPPLPTTRKFTDVYAWTRGGMLFTLMGDLPRAELKKIADSTR